MFPALGHAPSWPSRVHYSVTKDEFCLFLNLVCVESQMYSCPQLLSLSTTSESYPVECWIMFNNGLSPENKKTLFEAIR